jgi:hypothetical protein
VYDRVQGAWLENKKKTVEFDRDKFLRRLAEQKTARDLAGKQTGPIAVVRPGHVVLPQAESQLSITTVEQTEERAEIPDGNRDTRQCENGNDYRRGADTVLPASVILSGQQKWIEAACLSAKLPPELARGLAATFGVEPGVGQLPFQTWIRIIKDSEGTSDRLITLFRDTMKNNF